MYQQPQWQQQQAMYQQQAQQQFQMAQRKINLILHYRDEEIPLIVYRGTSEQTIYDMIREITNIYRFKVVNKKQQPVILSSTIPDRTHLFIEDPSISDTKEEESDEPTAEQQVIFSIFDIFMIQSISIHFVLARISEAQITRSYQCQKYAECVENYVNQT